MAWYSYKRVRQLMPKHLEDKYRAESDNPDEWFWDNDYNGDLFDGAADYIEELLAKINQLETELVQAYRK